MATGRPIAWLALEKGTPVRGRGGAQLGVVGRVVGDQQKDIFSGITIVRGAFQSERFAPAEVVGRITAEVVEVDLSGDDAQRLEPYQG